MRLLTTLLTLAIIAVASGHTQVASAKQQSCRSTKQGIEFYRGKTWQWQSKLETTRTEASLIGTRLYTHSGCAYLKWVSKLWQKRSKEQHAKYLSLSAPTGSLSTEQLYYDAQWEINHGGIYSHAYGAVSSRLKDVCYELVNRAFAPYGTQSWAYRVVNGESGCNPAAINYTYSNPGERATGLSQMIPNVHTWVNYPRAMRDMRYAIHVFIRLSRGGHSTGPWSGY